VKVLGIDASLVAFGWAMHDTEAPFGSPERCSEKGLFRTPSKMEFIDRYVFHRESLKTLIERTKPDRVGLEFPVFKEMYSEGCYGLFLFVCEALKTERCDVVFWAPMQAKAHARDTIDRPKGWKMDKQDMIEAARVDTGIGRWNHNEADAYLIARISGRFWKLYEGLLSESDLTTTEARYFTDINLVRRAGKFKKRGVIYREDERFFAWSSRE